MKQFLLATALIAVPVIGFTAFNHTHSTATASETGLGDMATFQIIVTDVQKIADTGDLTAAAARITDFETAWDDAAGNLRPLNGTYWGNVDDAADAALAALRASAPAPDNVVATLSTLMAELQNPALGPDGTIPTTLKPATIAGIAVSDASGRALPCEDMLTTLRLSLVSTNATAADKANAEALQVKATERCNADDDQHSDEFSAQALALLTD